MHTDQIYIARDGKLGMHVLVRILAVDDIGKDYLPIDPDDFNKLMMARDVRSLVLAARDLGPMYISADILSRRIFIPSHLRQHIEHGVNLAPSDIESLLSECYFDPYALPVETDDMGYRAIGRTGKKSTRELIDELDFTKAGDLSYLDSQFRAIVEPLHDWIFARNLLSILMRIGGLSIRMHLRCPRSQSLTVQGRASLVLLVFYHASTSYCGVTFTQLLEFLCPLIRNSRALVRCNSINCYNVSSLPWACKMALVRCNSISCYNNYGLV